ncbi:MAG: hypothetical protein RR405_00860 [Clostridia bacterium]
MQIANDTRRKRNADCKLYNAQAICRLQMTQGASGVQIANDTRRKRNADCKHHLLKHYK